jgi:plastocyanin
MKVAVVGTGIAGNVVAYLLASDHDLTVFEQNDYVGGHANTALGLASLGIACRGLMRDANRRGGILTQMRNLTSLGRRVRPLWAIGTLGFGLWGCGDDSGSSPAYTVSDGATPDSTIVDSAIIDGTGDTAAAPDVTAVDSNANDSEADSGIAPDSTTIDSAAIDGMADTGSAPDSGAVDSGSPDGGVEAGPAPDSGAVDSGSNDSSADTGVSDASASDSSTADSTAGDAADGGPQTFVVTVAPNGTHTFDPSTVTIHVGTSVQWQWQSGGHTVTSGTNCTADDAFCSPDDTNCATTPTSNSGSTYSHTFMQAGSFPYFCRPHCSMGMTGTVVVQ